MNLNKRPSVYLAAPLFNERERSFNVHLKETLKRWFDVFLPQEDGLLFDDLLHRGMNVDDARRMVFGADLAAMDECNILLAVLDGAAVDEGVAFEIGYMYSQGKNCVGLQTDVRRQLVSGNNPMIECSLLTIVSSVDELAHWCAAYPARVAPSKVSR